MKRLYPIRLALGLAILTLPALADTTIFFNGVPNFGGATDGNGANFLDCSTCRSAAGVEIYDDFVVPTGQLWTIDSLFGNYMLFANTPIPTSATWALVQGISQGNGGTVLASGAAAISALAIATPPGGNASDFYYKFTANITPTALGPGTYWMMLAPASSANETYLIGTDGTSGVNPVTDGTSYANGTYFTYQNIGAYEHPFSGFSNYDFSYGAIGTTTALTPEPGAGMLALAGSILVFGLRRRRS